MSKQKERFYEQLDMVAMNEQKRQQDLDWEYFEFCKKQKKENEKKNNRL